MPVRKFRHVGEMEETLWREPGDPALFRAIAGVWDFAERVGQPRFPPGVHKHRSAEEAEPLAETWEEANFRRFWERRRAGEGRSEGSAGR